MSDRQSFGGGLTAPSRRRADTVKRSAHREGHDLALTAVEALAPIEARRECPCCSARLWISVPSIGAILDTVAHSARSGVPDLGVDLTRRERQLLNVLTAHSYRSDTANSPRWCGGIVTAPMTCGRFCI